MARRGGVKRRCEEAVTGIGTLGCGHGHDRVRCPSHAPIAPVSGPRAHHRRSQCEAVACLRHQKKLVRVLRANRAHLRAAADGWDVEPLRDRAERGATRIVLIKALEVRVPVIGHTVDILARFGVIEHSVGKVGQLVGRVESWSTVGWSVGWLVGQSVGQLVEWSAGRLVGWSAGR